MREVYTCYLCGFTCKHSELTREHILPKSKGGNETTNIMPAHRRCNRQKSNEIILPKNYNGMWVPNREAAEQLIRYIECVLMPWMHVKNSSMERDLMCKCVLAYRNNTPVFQMLPKWEWIVLRGTEYIWDASVARTVNYIPTTVKVYNFATGATKYLTEEEVSRLR